MLFAARVDVPSPTALWKIPGTMTAEELRRLISHVAALSAHVATLEREMARGCRSISKVQFDVIARDIRQAGTDFDGVLPFMLDSDFATEPYEPTSTFSVEALRSHLIGAIARLESLSPGEFAKPSTNRGFLSHVSTDRALAEHFRTVLEGGAHDVKYFMASQRGAIRSGDPWCETIFRELRSADRFLILLTPTSVTRLWVSFETGAGWMSKQPIVLLAVGGLQMSQIPTPLSELHVLSLDGDGGRDALLQAFEQLGSRPPDDLDGFLREAHRLAASGTEEAVRESGWSGVQVGSRFYVWDGPLDDLEDRDPIVMRLELDAELNTALDEAGVRRRWLSKRLMFGAGNVRQVFVTNRKTYKREVIHGDVVLVVQLPD